MSDALNRVVRGGKAFLVDFDGPICSVFAGVPAKDVAADLRRYIRRREGVQLSPEVEQTQDPLEVIHWAGRVLPSALSRDIDLHLQQAEVAAVESAQSTPHADECIRAIYDSGVPLAIVSNNSALAIERYLALRNLQHVFSIVVGRPIGRPALMKPSPALIHAALVGIGLKEPASSVFIGDSVTDCQAARAAGVPVIAYANRPAKVTLLQAENPDALITHMSELATAIGAGTEVTGGQ